MKIGAHLSIAGGYHKALERVNDIGGNCLQIFSASPRGWNRAVLTDEAKQLFIETKKKLGIDAVFFHASYLINLADEGRIGDESKKSLIAELNVASQLGVVGSIVHTGSFKGSLPAIWDVSQDKKYSVLINNIHEVLTSTPQDTFLILENAGNKKIGQNIDELASIIRDVDNERLKICLDTCHLFSAGYALSTQKKLGDFLTEFDKKIGLKKLIVLHINDSRDPFDSGRDRHENIGVGTLSMEPFKLLVHDKRTCNLPFIIETPGFDGKGPDKKNIDILKSLV
ncbi:MAG: deoxyribonuclease IV [Candidatus Roizmanbacteria bacterium]|nr:deoxyribonuclease IV [Candidatus Roizmanbacteria bacterium]